MLWKNNQGVYFVSAAKNIGILDEVACQKSCQQVLKALHAMSIKFVKI